MFSLELLRSGFEYQKYVGSTGLASILRKALLLKISKQSFIAKL